MDFLESIKEILKQEVERPLAEGAREPSGNTRGQALIPPLLPGWLVAYWEQQRVHDGTVTQCNWTGRTWVVQLTTGVAIPLKWITSVGQTDTEGKVIAAWEIRAHGIDGERKRGKP